MLEMIAGFAGLVFAWGVLGYVLIPLAALLEQGAGKYVSYATVGEMEMPKPIDSKCSGLFIHRGEPTKYGVIWLTILLIMGLGLIVGNEEFGLTGLDLIIFATFGMWVKIGMWAWPAVVLGVAMYLPTFISRKMFMLKKQFDAHVADQKAHAAGDNSNEYKEALTALMTSYGNRSSREDRLVRKVTGSLDSSATGKLSAAGATVIIDNYYDTKGD